MNCPKCLSPLGELAIEDVCLDFCPPCKGIWFDKEELAFITELNSDLPHPQADRTVGKPTVFPCPRCDGKLEELKFLPLMDLLVDRCPACRGIWLDNGELQKIASIAKNVELPKSKIIRVSLQVKHRTH
jgi:Zn-finger nucleic acid-binding protein